jgi:prepilin peptidase CpaA
MSTFHLTSEMPAVLTALILLTAALAVVTDLRRRRISNMLTYPAMAIGFAVNVSLSGRHGLLTASSGLVLGSALFIVPVALGGMGAGDLKLAAALGALGGPGFALWCVIFASIVGGVFAVLTLIAKRQFVTVAGGMALAWYTRQPIRADSGLRIPFALPIALGAVTALTVR